MPSIMATSPWLEGVEKEKITPTNNCTNISTIHVTHLLEGAIQAPVKPTARADEPPMPPHKQRRIRLCRPRQRHHRTRNRGGQPSRNECDGNKNDPSDCSYSLVWHLATWTLLLTSQEVPQGAMHDETVRQDDACEPG